MMWNDSGRRLVLAATPEACPEWSYSECNRWAGHSQPTLFWLAIFGSFISYIYSAPPLKLKQSGWAGNYALGASYIALPWLAGQVRALWSMAPAVGNGGRLPEHFVKIGMASRQAASCNWPHIQTWATAIETLGPADIGTVCVPSKHLTSAAGKSADTRSWPYAVTGVVWRSAVGCDHFGGALLAGGPGHCHRQ